MPEDLLIPQFDFITCLSDALDLVNPVMASHHKQVAYIAFSIAREINLPIKTQNDLALAGALHDAGTLSLAERLDIINEVGDIHRHGEIGYRLCQLFEPFTGIAAYIRFHHVPWNGGAGASFNGYEVPEQCHILHLADRIAVRVDKHREVLGQVGDIRESIVRESGKTLQPNLVEAFTALSEKECFWLDVVSPTVDSTLSNMLPGSVTRLDMGSMSGFARLFSQIIDFKSPFTATHSSGVAAVAELIAEYAGIPERDIPLIRLAGYLHDLGKLAVPPEVLEKPGELNNAEICIMRSHPFHTYHILERFPGLHMVNIWASSHHERLDGKGYPFHFKSNDIPVESRILAVADVFCGITEIRPYRNAMNSEQALTVLYDMARKSALDTDIVALVKPHFEEISASRATAQQSSADAYRDIKPVQATRQLKN